MLSLEEQERLAYLKNDYEKSNLLFEIMELEDVIEKLGKQIINLEERFPEFVKYLPSEITKVSNLPADNSLIAALTKAGWPTKKKKK